MPLTADIKDLIEHDAIRARRLLRGLVEEMPRSAEAHLLLAQSHLRSLEFTAALAQYRAVVELDARSREALYSVAFCHLALGEEAAALDAYDVALARDPAPFGLAVRGLILHRLNRLGEAIAAYDKLVKSCRPKSPVLPFALQGMASVLHDAGRPLDARRHAQELAGLFRQTPLSVSSILSQRNNSVDYHEWSHYADKARLARMLQRSGAAQSGLRFPETFVLPEQREALAAHRARHGPATIYVAKPQRGTGGQGISVGTDITGMIDRDDIVVQRYMDRPYLIDGRKGHLRIYGLVTSARPLRAYAYTEGIVRIAPERYDVRPEHLGRIGMHVTNTALHLGHRDLMIDRDPSRDDTGNIWSLSALLRQMSADGHDPTAVLGRIVALVQGFIRLMAADGVFERQAQGRPPRAFAPKLFGLDVLVDEDGEPWLIEVQRKPAATGAPLVERINGELFATIFRMSMAPLLDDGAPAGEPAALADPDRTCEREIALEAANRGRFVPLELS